MSLLAIIFAVSVAYPPPSTVVEPLPVAENSQPGEGDLVFVGTVTKIVPTSDKLKSWAVTVRVERIVSGTFSGTSFTFAVHSPAISGLKVGKSYTIRATWTKDGYVVDERQWRRP
ncbi:MAG: hypothetical protein ACJ76Y_22570 [Thermoanaerobaculia bacterium]